MSTNSNDQTDPDDFIIFKSQKFDYCDGNNNDNYLKCPAINRLQIALNYWQKLNGNIEIFMNFVNAVYP